MAGQRVDGLACPDVAVNEDVETVFGHMIGERKPLSHCGVANSDDVAIVLLYHCV